MTKRKESETRRQRRRTRRIRCSRVRTRARVQGKRLGVRVTVFPLIKFNDLSAKFAHRLSNVFHRLASHGVQTFRATSVYRCSIYARVLEYTA